MPCHRTHRVEDAEIVVKPPLPTLSDAQYIQAQTERIEALERELSYQLNDTEYSKRLKGLELDNERLTAEVAALRTQLDEANADADKWCRKSNGRYDEIVALQAELRKVTMEKSEWECSAKLYHSELRDLAEGKKVETQLGFHVEKRIHEIITERDLALVQLTKVRPDTERMNWLEELFSTTAQDSRAWQDFYSAVSHRGFRTAIDMYKEVEDE